MSLVRNFTIVFSPFFFFWGVMKYEERRIRKFWENYQKEKKKRGAKVEVEKLKSDQLWPTRLSFSESSHDDT